MEARWLQEIRLCPYCKSEPMTRILITPKKYGYNAEYIRFCEVHGTVKSAYEKGA